MRHPRCGETHLMNVYHNPHAIISSVPNANYTGLDLPNAVTIEEGAFAGWHSLTGEITLPRCEVIKWGALSKCDNIRTVRLPRIRSIQNDAFNDCFQLQAVFLCPGVKIADDGFEWLTVFSGSRQLRRIDLGTYASREQLERELASFPMRDPPRRLRITATWSDAASGLEFQYCRDPNLQRTTVQAFRCVAPLEVATLAGDTYFVQPAQWVPDVRAAIEEDPRLSTLHTDHWRLSLSASATAADDFGVTATDTITAAELCAAVTTRQWRAPEINLFFYEPGDAGEATASFVDLPMC